METIPAKKSKLTLYIGIALVLGIIAGFILNKSYVGEENTRITNAELQSKEVLNQMKQFEKVKDTVVFATLLQQQKNLLAQKKDAENSLLNMPDGAVQLSTVMILRDSIAKINLLVAAQSDTVSSAYKTLVQQKNLISFQKNESLKARDKKLDWFTILADVF